MQSDAEGPVQPLQDWWQAAETEKNIYLYLDFNNVFSFAVVNLLILHCVPKKVSPLNILQQPPQTCTDLNEILHIQDDIYFCHRRQIS